LIYYLQQGVKLGIYPALIFLGIGATTDFGPLIANPKSLLLGAAAQIGIFLTFLVAIVLPQFNGFEAASIAIIGGADGPTAIFLTNRLAPHILGSVSIAAYSYMALVPVIQPPVIRLLTTKRERRIKMEQLREVSKLEKIIFPIAVTLVVLLLVPSCAPLIGCLMLGNLIKESGVVPKLTETAANSLLYIVTILLGVSVGATATGEQFLRIETLLIIGLGVVAFMTATAGGVLFGKLMCWITKGKVNPIIGAAGVSAVPMAARVAHLEGQREDPENYLLMHAMGPNVAGVIGSAIAAGAFMIFF
jgi:oxaloacetate decarboxylase beta subunit